MEPDQARRRIGTGDVRDLLRPFLLDRRIRRSSSGEVTTNLTFDTAQDAAQAAALICQAWGHDKVIFESSSGSRRLQVLRDIDRYGTWPAGWKRMARIFPPAGTSS